LCKQVNAIGDSASFDLNEEHNQLLKREEQSRRHEAEDKLEACIESFVRNLPSNVTPYYHHCSTLY
jgi:hypothetical protein